MAVVDGADRERREEAERGGECTGEDRGGVDGQRGWREEAERAERDVKHIAVGIKAAEREQRHDVLCGDWWRHLHGV